MNKLLALYRANQGKGAGLRALSEDEPRLLVYDVIVSSDADAEWLGGASAESFARAMLSMDAPRVHVHVNSPGGDAFAGIAMAQAIRAFDGEVVVHVDGIAASAASFLVAAADRVEMALGAMIMVHKAWTIALGNADDMLAQAELLDKLDRQQLALLADKSPDYDWETAIAAETWLDAEEAIAAGLADEQEAGRAAEAVAFDLSAFANAPAIPCAEKHDEPRFDDDGLALRRRKARLQALKPNT